MSEPLVITVPHKLGAEEARRRVATEIEQLKSEYINKFAYSEVNWAGNKATIRVVVLAQAVNANINVSADDVRIEIILPWLLAKLAAPLQNKLASTAQKTLSLGHTPDKS